MNVINVNEFNIVVAAKSVGNKYVMQSGDVKTKGYHADKLGMIYIDGKFSKVTTTLSKIKASKIIEIKAEAAIRIKALDWKIDRAKGREALGLEHDLLGAYGEVEAVRVASNVAEKSVMLLTSNDEIENFKW